jgi:regulatory protein
MSSCPSRASKRPSKTARRGPRETFAERRARRAEVDDPTVVLEAALQFLEARHRSVAEVRRRLTGAGYREELVTGAIDRLSELGMLDDEAFATQWVESRDRARPRGERALRTELAQRGVDRAVVDATLVERRDRMLTDADAVEPAGMNGDRGSPDEAAARRLIERREASLRRYLDPRERRNRAYALLARNGFDPATASEVARRWVAEGADEVDADAEPDVRSGIDET